MRRLRSRAFWNPLSPTGLYAVPHLVILVLVGLLLFGLGFASGWRASTIYTRQYWAQHYRFPGLKTPPPGTSAPIRDVHRAGLPSATSVDLSVYPAVGNQGSLGACAAWASAWAASYELRKAGVGWIRLSPIWIYSRFSDLYSGGQDGGSWPDQDLETLGSSGIPQWKQLPAPPYQIDNPLPITNVLGMAMVYRRHGYQIHVISGFAQGAGQGAVDGLRAAIAAGHPVMIAFPVYPEYDNATQQPLVVSPTAGEVSRGGHENVAIAYDDTKILPDGTVGGVELQNQWTKQWGTAGRAWLSYDFVRRYSFGLEYLTLGASAPHAPHFPHDVPPQGPTHSIVPKGYETPLPLARPSAWRVKNVFTHDTHVDLTAAFNYWGTKYNVWPVGMVAIAATESGINQYADRWGVWPDVSFGLSQFTVATANGYGVPGDAYAVRAYLNNPFNSIQLEARYLHDAEIATCLDFPTLYSAYNIGSGYGCNASIYYHPTGQAATNYYGNWLGNYTYVLNTYSDYGPAPKPTPKPRIVCGKRLSLTYNRRAGFYFGHFWYCNRWTWPKYHYRQKTVVTWKKR